MLKRPRLAVAATLVFVVSTASIIPAQAAPRTSPALRSRIAHGAGIPNRLRVGVTYTHLTVNPWDAPSAVASAKSVLKTVKLQNEMLMGWGVGNPEPSPGVYDFGGLDARLALIRSTGGTPVITLCGAPDWMKGGVPGQTDWSKLATAPLPQYYGAFAQLAVTVAKRYPDVQTFQVWNEMKGFFDAAKNRWNYEAYTAFYNTVYDALKAYDPALKVGGPYVVFDSSLGKQPRPSVLRGSWGTLDQRDLDVVKYWLAHKHGADFVAVDGTTTSKDAKPATTNVFAGVNKLLAVTRWLKARTALPIWWSELYPYPARWRIAPTVSAALTAYTVMALARAGVSATLLWQEPHAGFCDGPCLWTDTRIVDGGKRTAMGTAVLHVTRLLRRGTRVRLVTNLPRGVVGYAVGGEVMLVNTTKKSVSVDAPNQVLRLPARQATFTMKLAS